MELSERLFRRRNALLHSAGLLSLFLAKACLASSSGITACPHMDGFKVWPDKRIPADTSGNAGAINLGSADPAYNYCGGNPECKAFDNKGQTYYAWDQVIDEVGYCLYYYEDCPAYDGFTAVNRVSFRNASSFQYTGALQAALTFCKGLSNCPGVLVDNSGKQYVMNANLDAFAPQAGSNCLYLDNSAAKAGFQCFPKYGLTVYSEVSPTAVAGSFNAGSATLSDATEAVERCKVNPRCTAWSTAGKIVVGGLGALEWAGEGTCTYAKQECPPMATFTAYWSQTPSSTASSQDKTLCLADTYTKCKNDVTCMGFDTLRRFWDVRPSGYTSMPGVCTYVKADGF